MSLAGHFCGIAKGEVFLMLGAVYCAALIIIATHDDRFVRNYFEFQAWPFSYKQFGLAAVASMVSVVCFLIIAVAPRNCV